MNRVEIKLQEIQQRQTKHRNQDRADDDHNAMFFEKMIQRSQKRVTDRLLFSRRIEQHE